MFDGRKRPAVRDAGAMLADRLYVSGHAVPLVLVKAVLGMILMQSEHEPVSSDLRHVGCCCGELTTWEWTGRRQRSSSMQRVALSQTTLAMMEAAAMTVHLASPLTTVWAVEGSRSWWVGAIYRD